MIIRGRGRGEWTRNVYGHHGMLGQCVERLHRLTGTVVIWKVERERLMRAVPSCLPLAHVALAERSDDVSLRSTCVGTTLPSIERTGRKEDREVSAVRFGRQGCSIAVIAVQEQKARPAKKTFQPVSCLLTDERIRQSP